MDTNDVDIAALRTAIDQYLGFLRSIGPDEPETVLQSAFLARKHLLSAREKARSARASLPDFTEDELPAVREALISMQEDAARSATQNSNLESSAYKILQTSCNKLLLALESGPAPV